MTERNPSPADAALRGRLTELSVHIPCGGLRGPLQRRPPAYADLPVLWQSCKDEDSPEKWEGCDVSREYDLCVVCVRATAGGRSRWSWLACENCRAINSALESAWGFRPLLLGRHSIMNGIGVSSGMSAEVIERQTRLLAQFASNFGRIYDWQEQEFGRLASVFDPLADVPLRTWQQQWPPSRSASIDAFSRRLDTDLPMR